MTITLDADIYAVLLDQAERGNAHWHREHARWDRDGSPCDRCVLLDTLRPREACRSCEEHYP